MYERNSTENFPDALTPTDFLGFSREFARQVGLNPDISTWQSDEFQVFLDWWLLRTQSAFSDEEDRPTT